MKIDILGVKIDKVNMAQALEQVGQWVNGSVKPVKARYIVTPNPEMVIAAQGDFEFKKILNEADLAIPDSIRLGWADNLLGEKNLFTKILKWPFFIAPKIVVRDFDTVAGTDLMEELVKLSAVQAFRIGLLGGPKMLADRLDKVLIKKYPGLKVVFVEDGGNIDKNGNVIPSEVERSFVDTQDDKVLKMPPTDILFVAFGHGKQEKWIVKNLDKYPVKVMIGVGGAFDYLLGSVARAPKQLRNLGFEWVFRLFYQPWRIKRFWSLVRFIFLVLLKSSSKKDST